METDAATQRMRLWLALLGAAAGTSFWLLLWVLPDMGATPKSLIFPVAFASAFFMPMLLMTGIIGIRRALLHSAGMAILSSTLLFWSSLRFSEFDPFMESAHPVIAFFLLINLPVPFVLAFETTSQKWNDYNALFDHAWGMTVRMAAAGSFVGVFWIVLLLSDQLLSLVGFTYLGQLVGNFWFSLPLTGLVGGIALAVLNELSLIVSTLRRLALNLLRLLLPPVCVVIALFLALVPFQGLEKVFGSFSAAGTMLAMAFGAITLITSAIDGSDDHASKSKVMTISARVMGLLLPVITGIAVFAILLRVNQYGWTPARLSGALVSIVLLSYSAVYALSALSKDKWRNRIRQSNVWMALGVISLSALWLSPILDAERISASSHFDRFISGRLSVDDLDVWRLGDDWGKAGSIALGRLELLEDHKEQTALNDKLARYKAGQNLWEYQDSAQSLAQIKQSKELGVILPVRPVGQLIPEGMLGGLPLHVLKEIRTSCSEPLSNGESGCVLALGELAGDDQKPEGVVLWRGFSGRETRIAVLSSPKGQSYQYTAYLNPLGADMREHHPEDIITSVLNGGFKFAPAHITAFEVDGMQIIPRE